MPTTTTAPRRSSPDRSPRTSAARVPAHTEGHINARIARKTHDSIRYHARHPERIERRLRELDAEWDTERLLETNAATLALTGTVLGLTVDKRWFALPAAVTGFLLQHGVQGWCPPLPVLRRLGVRTPREIEAERYALKAIRGDFEGVPDDPHPAEAATRATGRFRRLRHRR
jgi:hypothetical protein